MDPARLISHGDPFLKMSCSKLMKSTEKQCETFSKIYDININ